MPSSLSRWLFAKKSQAALFKENKTEYRGFVFLFPPTLVICRII